MTFGQAGPADGEETEPTGDSTFTVVAERTSSSCGTGELTLDAAWSFETELIVHPRQDTIDWNAGKGSIEGTMSLVDRSFGFESSFVVDMRAGVEGAENMPPCKIQRVDSLEGKLDHAMAPSAFEGTLIFAFEPTPGSDCTDLLLGPTKLVEKLPCSATYAIEGTLIEAEAEEP